MGVRRLAAPAARAADPAQGPGGPILVVTSSQSTYGTYYAEILRTEGFNAFQVADIGAVSPTMLAAYDVVILAKMPLTAAQVTMLSDWVNGGRQPDRDGARPRARRPARADGRGRHLADGYLLVDTSTPPGNGIVGETIQFHGTADLYTLNGATAVATLYSSAPTATTQPGGHAAHRRQPAQAAAFTYDLATSVVYTRQGNPAWATQERDGFAPIRSDDKFFGNAAGDPQPDWVDLTRSQSPRPTSSSGCWPT